MPIPALSTRDDVVSDVVPDAGPLRSPSPGFEAALAAQRSREERRPTVSLGQMVAAFAGRSGGVGASDTMAGPTGPAQAVAPSSGAGSSPAEMATPGAGAAVLAAGERYLGVPYLWGGTDPATGFDCSGLVQQVYADLGISLPRVSVDQSRAGVAVDGMDDAQPGDLVFWEGNGSRPNHIGIYAGDGRMLVAPSRGDVVRYQEITRTPHAIRRVIG